MKKLIIFLVCILMLNLVGMPLAMAMDYATAEDIKIEDTVIDISDLAYERVDLIENVQTSPCGTASFDWSISSGKINKDVAGFLMRKNETITIEATFTPQDADIDFGLVTPDGFFYATSGKDGKFNQTIRVDQSGDYYLAIRNNSDKTVNAMGYVYY